MPDVPSTFFCRLCLGEFPGSLQRQLCIPCAQAQRKACLRARGLLVGAILAGKVPRLWGRQCVDCGDDATVYEHRDYSRPLDVQPVCRGCNTKRGPAGRRDFCEVRA